MTLSFVKRLEPAAMDKLYQVVIIVYVFVFSQNNKLGTLFQWLLILYFQIAGP